MKESGEIEAAVRWWIWRQVAAGTLEQGAAAHQIAARMMVQRDGDLDQSLKELAIRLGSRAPDIFQRFVSVEEKVFVKEAKAFPIRVVQHGRKSLLSSQG